jgi:hypothetical protein
MKLETMDRHMREIKEKIAKGELVRSTLMIYSNSRHLLLCIVSQRT